MPRVHWNGRNVLIENSIPEKSISSMRKRRHALTVVEQRNGEPVFARLNGIEIAPSDQRSAAYDAFGQSGAAAANDDNPGRDAK